MLRKLILIITSLFWVSCYVAPQSIYILEPAEKTDFWLTGKQYYHSKTDDFEVAMAFDKIDNHTYEFNMEISNISEKSFIISHENFYMVARGTIGQVSTIDTCAAIDPEREIMEANKYRSKEYASYQSAKATHSLFYFLDLVTDIADIGEPKSDAEILEEENEDLQREVDELETDLEHERSVKSINNFLSKWESKALRKTTLPHDFLIHGKIYFPMLERADSLAIHIELLGEHIVFQYNQFEEKVE